MMGRMTSDHQPTPGRAPWSAEQASRVRAAREALGLTVEQLSEKALGDAQMRLLVLRIESPSAVTVPVNTLVRVCKGVGLDPVTLLPNKR